MFNKIYESIKCFMRDNWLFLVAIIVTISFFLIRVPYQVEMPGGIIDLNNRVTINGEEVDTEGSFNMAYVRVSPGNLPYVLLSFIIPDWDLVKNSDYTYENETIEDSRKRDKLYLEESKDFAIVAALKTAGIPYETKNRVYHVGYVSKDSKSNFEVGDSLLEVNGIVITDVKKQLGDIIKDTPVGDKLYFKVLRNNKEVDVEAEVYEEKDAHYVGVSIITTYDIESDLDIQISSRASESGPSGGMMMALMTYNAIMKKDLTKGKKIVGTGLIDENGNVGAIGGVKYKLMGAVNNHADIFLVPAGENYEEALKVKKDKKYKIEIVPIETLKDAIDYLEGL